jgi:hypothetical protein
MKGGTIKKKKKNRKKEIRIRTGIVSIILLLDIDQTLG